MPSFHVQLNGCSDVLSLVVEIFINMYKPKPPRPKKTSICRSRDGCYTCRQRHRKCDLGKPTCSNCARRGLECDGYAQRLTWIPASVGASENPQRPRRMARKPLNDSNPSTFLRDVILLHSQGSACEQLPQEALHISDGVLLGHYSCHMRHYLEPIVGGWLTELSSHPQLRPALFALSASHLFICHLFHSENTQAGIGSNTKRRPIDAIAQSLLRYITARYDEAIQSLVHMLSPTLSIATTLLLALVEWETGSVHGSFIHMDGADAIVYTSHKEPCKTPIGHHLLQSWADMRARRNRQRLPFRPLSVELQTHSNPRAETLFRYNSQYLGARLTSLLADADTLRSRLVLNLCAADEGVSDDGMPDRFRHWFSSAFEYEYPDEFDTQRRCILTRDETLQRLHDVKAGLQIWRAAQEPRPCFSSFDKDFENLEGQWVPVSPIEPVGFPTPAITFDYLRYCLCLVLSSPQVVNTYLLVSRPDSTSLLVPSIVARMLSIIEGLVPAEVIHYDVYNTGPLWMLVTFVFCVPHRKIVSYILDTVLPRFERTIERGPLLIAFTHTKNMISCIRSQMENGIVPLYCAESSLITEDLILSPASRFGRKYAIIGRDASGAFRRIVIES